MAAQTFRQNPAFDTEKAITELGVGEALVSTLEGKGAPSMVERTLIAPPMAQVGPIDAAERQRIIAASPLRGKYEQAIDPEFGLRDAGASAPRRPPTDAKAAEGGGGILDMLGGLFGTSGARKGTMTVGQRVTREVTRTVVNQTVGIARGRARQIPRRTAGQLHRPGHRARDLGRVAAAVALLSSPCGEESEVGVDRRATSSWYR